jgi:uncharacterized protein (DUF1810 family)
LKPEAKLTALRSIRLSRAKPQGNHRTSCEDQMELMSNTFENPDGDPFDLQRFVVVQERFYTAALSELTRGQKRSHWMWFIFPQAAGLGHSATAQRYAIKSRAEAGAYLAHPVLGPRLRQCATAVLAIPLKSANQIFGSPDDLKFRSSMTLFDAISGNPLFGEAIERYFAGRADQMTHDILASWTS